MREAQKKILVVGENATAMEVSMEEAVAEIAAFILGLAPANDSPAFRLDTRFTGTKIIGYAFFTVNQPRA